MLPVGEVFRTQQRRAERALEASERRSRVILESAGDAFLLPDAAWRAVERNAAAEAMPGAVAGAPVGRNWFGDRT